MTFDVNTLEQAKFEDVDVLEGCNLTELYQLCRMAEINAPPGSTEGELIRYLTGELEPPTTPNPIDQWRDDIMSFILEHWSVLESQLSCPAKTKNPKACYQCIDSQVMSCLVTNKTHLVQLRRSK